MQGFDGKILDNTYRVEALLGRGGMGAVYRAVDIRLNRSVALKVMHPHLTQDIEFRGRFLQEAQAIAALDHPGIVEVHALGEDREEGLLFIVMDYVPGQTLQTWVKRLAEEHKIVALAESLEIVRQVALGLHYAHEKGVLHRDIKPANILLKPVDAALGEAEGVPFYPIITDFGLAKLAEGGVQTRTGTTMGTPAYMAPEQCMGYEPERQSDVYSLGVVLYELATGRVPFEARTLTEAIRQHTQEMPPPPRAINPTLPVDVEDLILRTLAKRPGDRFTTAREMADALKEAMDGLPTGLTVRPGQMQALTIGEGPSGVNTAYASLATRLADSVLPAQPSSDLWQSASPPGPPGRPSGRAEGSLVVLAPDGITRRIPLGGVKSLIVGRTANNDVHIDDPKVSRHHARIDADGPSLTVTDLNSTNGTFLGKSRLLPGVGQTWAAGVSLGVVGQVFSHLATVPGTGRRAHQCGPRDRLPQSLYPQQPGLL